LLESNFINQLLDALRDERVKKMVHSIVNDEANVKADADTGNEPSRNDLEVALQEALQLVELRDRQLTQLQYSLNKERAKIENLEGEITRLTSKNNELSTLQEDLHSQLVVKENQINRLSNRFKEAEAVYQYFLQLSPLTHDSLRRNLRGNSLEEFIYSGVQYENIESLWEYMRRSIMEEDLNDIPNLQVIFNYFFESYNKINPLFQFQMIALRQTFDGDQHMRSKDSKVMGPISEILLPGYINTKTSKVIKKSIVKI
jgi:hypothetical protein